MTKRQKPSVKYCGLTIIMSNPSRFDEKIGRLLTANGGKMLNDFCLRPEYNHLMCDVHILGCNEPLLPETKCVLILGELAMRTLIPELRDKHIGEVRGGVYEYLNVPCMVSYLPQEAVDIKNYESKFNSLSNFNLEGFSQTEEGKMDSENEDTDVKRHGVTKRRNWSFWLRRDVWKCKQILAGKMPKREVCSMKIQFPAELIIQELEKHKNEDFFFDIETDFEEQNLQCFSFSFGRSHVVWGVPILDYNYKLFYGKENTARIMKALAVAIRDNCVVAHNGANFDFLVLGYKYRIPIGDNVYDTMIAHHRCFPDVERSLGHVTSYWTWERFHKDEDSLGYNTKEQMRARLEYCCKDVFTMSLVKEGIDAFSEKVPGLKDSILEAMKCIRPYLTFTLRGINMNEESVKENIKENDRLMMQYDRMIWILIGKDNRNKIQPNGSKTFFSLSNKQCVKYFHEMLCYDVVGYGKADDVTGKMLPSLGKKNLYKLMLKYNNPVITLINEFREVKKETGRLLFEEFDMHKI